MDRLYSYVGLTILKPQKIDLHFPVFCSSIPRQDLIRQLADWLGMRGPSGLPAVVSEGMAQEQPKRGRNQVLYEKDPSTLLALNYSRV